MNVLYANCKNEKYDPGFDYDDSCTDFGLTDEERGVDTTDKHFETGTAIRHKHTGESAWVIHTPTPEMPYYIIGPGKRWHNAYTAKIVSEYFMHLLYTEIPF